MEESYAKAHGYDILGIVGDYAEVGCDPQYGLRHSMLLRSYLIKRIAKSMTLIL